jgi:ATP-binding cassette subfamily F protein 3
MLVQATKIEKAYGTAEVLRGVSFLVSPGDKVGLVGPNGGGKTTLLSIILRELEPDDGDIVFGGEPAIGYLRQDVLADESLTVSGALLGEMEQLERRLALIRDEIAENPDDEAELVKCEVLEEELDTSFGSDYRSRAEKTLGRFGFGRERYDVPVRKLSPGERARLELARILVGRPEFLVLDEPTNYLDVGQREWLEKFLEEFEGTVLAVSHDRVFLDRVVTRIFDVRRGSLKVYEGDYSDYELAREQERRSAEEKHAQQTKEIRRLEQAARDRKAWSLRKEKEKTAHADKGFIGHRAAKMARRAKHAEKRIDQMLETRRADKPFIEKQPKPVLVTGEVPDKRAVLVKGVHKSFGRQRVLSGVGFEVRTREKVALVGPNGCGKTVLLRMLVNELEPDKGSVSIGAGLKVGYFPQDLGSLDLDATALEEVMKSGASHEMARTVLGTLLLPKEFAARRLSRLSAGERSKVLLARILAGGADFLILDEPTNHLDIDALRALESLMVAFPGGVLFASLDRAMLEKLAGRVIELREGKAVDYAMSYKAYRAKRPQD